MVERRPYTAESHILVEARSDYAFSSDHALVVAGPARAGLWRWNGAKIRSRSFLLSRLLDALAAATGSIMAFVRGYIGSHYPLGPPLLSRSSVTRLGDVS